MIVFAIFWCVLHLTSGMLNGNEKGELIASLSKKLYLNNVVLITTFREQGATVALQKNLNSRLEFYTTVMLLQDLENCNPGGWENRALIVIHSDTADNLQKVSHQIGNLKSAWICLSAESLKNLDSLFIPFNSKFLTGVDNGLNVRIQDVYQVDKYSDKIYSDFGVWSTSAGLTVRYTDFVYTRRNLNGVSLRFALLDLKDPFDPCSAPWVIDSYVYECLNFKLWHELSHFYNFKTNYTVMSNVYSNGSSGHSTPMLDKLRKDEVDVAMEPLVLTSYRLLMNAYFWPITADTMYVYTKIPANEINFSSYLKPFSGKLWFAMLGWVVGMGAFTTFVKFVFVKGMERRNFRFFRDAADESVAPLSVMCSQSAIAHGSQNMTAIRLLILVMHLVPLIILPAYSGGILSFLANPAVRPPFRNLLEFERNGKYKMVAEKDSYIYKALKTDDRLTGIREKNLIPEREMMPDDHEEGFRMTCRGKFSHVVNQPIFTRKPIQCKVYTLEEAMGTMMVTMAARKNFPYMELFNRLLQRRFICGIRDKQMEKTIMEKLKIRMQTQKMVKMYVSSQFENVRSCDFQDTVPVFAVLAGGMVITIVVLVLEMCSFRWKGVHEFRRRH